MYEEDNALRKWRPLARDNHTADHSWGGVGLVFLLSILKENLSPPAVESVETMTDSTTEVQVKLIAARFACTCGACGGEPLDHCTCDAAAGTRQEIREGLLAGRTSDQIIGDVNRTHGGLREELSD